MSKHKVLLTYLFFIFLFVLSYFYNQNNIAQILSFASLFALSGAVTNWLAVHMLFEKIPFIIGSGVIVNNFEGFKNAIRNILLENFFRKENFQLVAANSSTGNWKTNILAKIDFSSLFDAMKKDLIDSSEGSLLKMFGGEKILENFRVPFEESAKKKVNELLQSIDLQDIFSQKENYHQFLEKIKKILDSELAGLTPQAVKKIVSDIIRSHLSWLVVWGGFFGFLLGLLSSLFFSY